MAPALMHSLQKVRKQLRQSLRAAKFRVRELRAKMHRKIVSTKIIAVTGSSGKTTTVSLLAHILAGEHRVKWHATGNGYGEAVRTIGRLRRNDEFAVLEQGTSGPGKLARAANLIRPDVAIVTLVALEHFTAFRSIDAVAEEKSAFVKSLSRAGLAVLNYDDPFTRAMSTLTTARCVTFGTSGGDYVVSEVVTSSDGFLSFELTRPNVQSLQIRTQLIGSFNWLSAAAAVTTALELGVSKSSVAKSAATFAPLMGRMSAHHTPEGSRLVMDTVKAPYHSVTLPLATLASMHSPSKRFVLGQISDYAGNSDRKYRNVYEAAVKVADEVCFVGPTAHKARPLPAHVETGKFRAFKDVRALAEHLKTTAREHEVILVKSSKNLHLERLLLDRIDNVQCWPTECGVGKTCMDCGLYRHPFSEHGGQSAR
jgi:UDP-N-acetylmuramoyl-tripeptide--D-alanyl-D-alanine ligase